MGDNADVLALGLQNRPLFDVQFEKRMHLACAHLFFAAPADPRQFVAEQQTFRILAVVGPIEVMHPAKNPRGQHRRREPRAFLVGPVGHDDRMPWS